jgi:hypothetical protein
MPFNTNNVDLSVNANSLFGLSLFLQNYDRGEVEKIFDSELRKMFSDVCSFLKWGIVSEIILRRPDLSLTYYPSVPDFYWFVARLYNFLKNEKVLGFKELT